MRVAIVGCGYVGIVTGACLAKGHHVYWCDVNKKREAALASGASPIREPGVGELLRANEDRLHVGYPDDADVAIICVGTPSWSDGSADVSQLYDAAEEAARRLRNARLIIKSTAPIGTAARLSRALNRRLISLPEFLAEGTAVRDFMNADRIVVGHANDDLGARNLIIDLCEGIVGRGTRWHFTDNTTAELVKYASNCMLAARLSLVNEIADISEACGADIEKLFRAVGDDDRIGRAFLRPGPAWGGSCFGKDTRALAFSAQKLGRPSMMVETASASNELRRRSMADRIRHLAGDGPVGILGAAFKGGTDDMRESAATCLARDLAQRGIDVRIHDPIVPSMVLQRELPSVTVCADIMQAAIGASLICVMTDHDLYRNPGEDNIRRIASVMDTPCVYDARRLWPPEDCEAVGMEYHGVGYATTTPRRLTRASTGSRKPDTGMSDSAGT